MADLVPAPASMVIVRGTIEQVVFGETVAHGAAVYRDLLDGGRWKNSSAAAAATAVVNGIAWSAGGRDQIGAVMVPVITADTNTAYVSLGVGVVQGQEYVVSRNAGMIAPRSDLAGSDIIASIGVGDATNFLNVRFHSTGVAVT